MFTWEALTGNAVEGFFLSRSERHQDFPLTQPNGVLVIIGWKFAAESLHCFRNIARIEKLTLKAWRHHDRPHRLET
jgi:hypothetical protein